MKNVNIKKVVAGAAALAIAAGSLGAVVSAANVADSSYTTPNGLARADMFNAQGAPSYNIVVGSTGHASDVVWAANIAAAIGKKAYNVSTASATGGDVVVEVGAEGVTSVSGDGKLYDTDYLANVGSFTPSLKDSTFSKLVNMDVEYDDKDGDSETLKNVKDTLAFTFTDVYFENNKDVQSLLMKIPGSTGITYTLNLDTGIPANLTTSTDHDLTIPFLGDMYTVKSAAYDKIELISEANKQSYLQGDTFTIEGAGSYEGQTLTVEVSTVSNNSRVMLRLMDGTTVLSSETIKEGKSTTFDGKAAEITIPTVNYADNSGSYIEVTLSSGASIILKDADRVDELKDGEREWTVNFTCFDLTCNDNTDLITKIELTNDDGWDQLPIDGDEDYPALKPGESAKLPGNLGTVDFIGLKNEAMYDLETKSGMINWTDKDDEQHSIPMYQERAAGARMNLDIDGKTYYFHYNAGDTITVREGSDVTSDVVAGGIFTVQQVAGAGNADTASWVTSAGLATIPVGTNTYADADAAALVKTSYFYITSDVDDSTKLYYTIVDNGGQWGVALAPKVKLTAGNLDVDTTHVYPLADATNGWKFTGTDDDATGGVNAFYFNGKLAKNTGMSIFSVVDVDSLGTSGVNFVIDPNTKKLANSKDYSGNPTLTYKIKYDESTVATYDFVLDDEDTDDIKEGVTLRGTELKIISNEVSIAQPEKQRAFEMFIGGGATSSTTMIGDQVTLTTPGEVVDADGIKVKLVSAPQGSATTYTPAAFGNIAYLDTDTLPAGNKIIVGGWMVNEEAKNLGLQDLVTKAGDFVAGKNAQGNIVVAGFHKEDTANAAKELISAIEAMN